MDGRVRHLEWDSEFFGFSIGSAELLDATDDGVAAIEAEARDRGITCLYGSLDPTGGLPSARLQDWGWRLVEVATTFELRVTEPPIPRPRGATVRLGDVGDLAALAEAIDGLAPWSRFAADPRFGVEAARRLQWALTRRAAEDGTGRQLVVAELDGAPVAFITRCTDPGPRVDSVGTTARGSGASRYLIEDSRRWAGDVPLLGGPIAARNVHALRYVAHCGYRVQRVEYKYHRWLDRL